MTAPVPYNITTNFEDEEVSAVAGRSTVRTAQLDTELQNVETTLDSIITNLGLIQRDDGALKDATVGLAQLSAEALAMLAGSVVVARGPWVTATAYARNDLVTQSSNVYICLVDHTSGTFSTDLAANKWMVWSYAFNNDTELVALAGVTAAADRLPYFTGSSSATVTPLTAAARTLLDDASVDAMRTTLAVAKSQDVSESNACRLFLGTSSLIGSNGQAPAYSSIDSAHGEHDTVAISQNVRLNFFKECTLALYDNAIAAWRVLYIGNSLSNSTPVVALPATTNTNYDIFAAYDPSGGFFSFQVVLEAVAWTNDTTRATGLIWQAPGILCKSSDPTRRYMGTVRTGSVSGNVEDSPQRRFVWNFHNRVRKRISHYIATNSWNWSTDSFQEMNGVSTNRIGFLCPAIPFQGSAMLSALAQNSTSTPRRVQVGIGLNNTTPLSAVGHGYAVTGEIRQLISQASFRPRLGFNELYPLERGAGTDVQTWYGTNSGTELAVGLHGWIEC